MAVDEPLSVSAGRVARNDVTFRRANEQIRALAHARELDGALPAICECADASCTALVSLSPAEYEAVRAHPTRFLKVRGHEEHAYGWARVVADHGRYVVVEKMGEAAEIVRRRDPRVGG